MADQKKMVSLTIEGRPVTVPRKAPRSRGGEDGRHPHPALLLPPSRCPLLASVGCASSIVEKAPKLPPACAPSVAEGQVVSTRTDRALEARKGVPR